MKQPSVIEGHIILYCKGHYKTGTDFLIGIRRIWAIRCGLDEEHTLDKGADTYIADSMLKLIVGLVPERMDRIYYEIHQCLEKPKPWYKDLNPLENLIMLYRSEIAMIQIQEKIGDEWWALIKLPKPNNILFEKIINGFGEHSDFKLIS